MAPSGDTRRPRGGAPLPDGWGPEAPDAETLLDRMTLALLPLRLFLGVTFVYAGVDKLIDPAFLRATGPGSIGAQMDGFVKVSPIAPLIQVFGQTFPVEIGFLIAVAEIAVGLGTLTGLLFRLLRGRWAGPVDHLLADRLVGDEAVLLRAGPALRVRLADARAGRHGGPADRRQLAPPGRRRWRRRRADLRGNDAPS